MQFTFLEDHTMPDLIAALKAQSPDSLVFYSFFSHDNARRFFEYDQSATIARAIKVPIYGTWDFNPSALGKSDPVALG